MRIALYTMDLPDEYSEELQKKELRLYCAKFGWEIVAEFSDRCHGDIAAPRPSFHALISAALQRKIDAVIVWKLTVIAQSASDLLILNQLIANKIHFIACADGMSTVTPMWGMVMPRVFASIAAVIQRELTCGLMEKQKSLAPSRAAIAEAIQEKQNFGEDGPGPIFLQSDVWVGIRNARTKAVTFGRPRRKVDIELARMLQAEGRGLREIARLMNVGPGTLAQALKVAGASDGEKSNGKPENSNDSE